MTQVTISNEGAFDKSIRDDINDNFDDLYSITDAGTAAIVTLNAAVIDGGGTIDSDVINGIANRPRAQIAAASVSITREVHANRINVITGTDATTLTLPAASGTGNVYRFYFGESNTSGTVFVTDTPAAVDMRGSVNILDVDSNAQTAYAALTSDDTMTLNGTTTGGQVGDWVEFVDLDTSQWSVTGQLTCPSGSNVADPFSSSA